MTAGSPVGLLLALTYPTGASLPSGVAVRRRPVPPVQIGFKYARSGTGTLSPSGHGDAQRIYTDEDELIYIGTL